MIADGRIRPDLDAPTLSRIFMVLGDGLFWRRAVDPAFDIETTLPGVMGLIRLLLKPVEDADSRLAPPRLKEAAS
jgi:hypothetical protein